MSHETRRRTVTIKNRQGLHARPADLFVRKASEFESSIFVVKRDQRVEGKSIMNVLTLAAEQGTKLEIEATGPDAEAALEALAKLIESEFNFSDEETVDQE